MMNFSFDIVAILALVTASLTLIFTFTQNLKLRAQLTQQMATIEAMKADISAVCAGAVGLGEHMATLEQRAYQLGLRQEKIEMADPAAQSYRHASKMIKGGAALEEVMEDCGLARGEAELIALAQRIKKAS